MIRIDLLPDYVAKRRLTLLLMWVFGVFFVVITCSLLAFNFLVLVPQVQTQQALATDDASKKSDIDALNASASSTLAQIQPIQEKLQFVDDVQNYNRSWVALYDQLARYTDSKVVYASTTVTGATMAISVYTPSIDEVGRYLERMYEEPDFSTVSIDHLPAYPESVIDKFYLDGKLIAVGDLPGLDNARPGTANGAGRGGPGQQNSSQYGQNPGQGGQPNGLNNRGGGLDSNGLPTYGTVINPLTAQEIPNGSLDEAIDAVVSPLATGDQVTRLRDVVRQRLLRQVVVKHQIRGFQLSVTAVLKKPLTPPAVPGTAAVGGAAVPGAFGGAGMGGGMGAPAGMPGGAGGPGAINPGGRP